MRDEIRYVKESLETMNANNHSLNNKKVNKVPDNDSSMQPLRLKNTDSPLRVKNTNHV